jgi:hypothetical protein
MSHKSRRRRRQPPRTRRRESLATSMQLQELRGYGFEAMGSLSHSMAEALLEAFRG